MERGERGRYHTGPLQLLEEGRDGPKSNDPQGR